MNELGRQFVNRYQGNFPLQQKPFAVVGAELGVDGEEISGLSTLFRKIWSLGDAGVTVPLTLHRDSQIVSVTVESAARADYLKKPRVN